MGDERHLVRLGEELRRRGFTVAVAESCTGGMLGGMLTEVAGSSDYFLGGVIAYSDRLKMDLLRVPGHVINTYGAVSAECALLMARGVRAATGASIGISVTGIAGPGGATPSKPVGTTYIVLIGPGIERVEHFCWSGNRSRNREQSAIAALSMLTDYLSETSDVKNEERMLAETGA